MCVLTLCTLLLVFWSLVIGGNVLPDEEQYLDIDLTLFETKKTEPKYSSFHCTSGNQDFSEQKLQHVNGGFPEANDVQFRTCLFRNVCIINHKIVFYERPESHNYPASFRLVGSKLEKKSSDARCRRPVWGPDVVKESNSNQCVVWHESVHGPHQ